MKAKVTEKDVRITEISQINEGEYGINRCDITLPKAFEGLSVTAVFNGIPVPVTDGKCIIPTLPNGNCIFGVYAYKMNGEEMELMYSPRPTMFFVGKGSFCKEISEEILPEVFSYETYCMMLQGYWRELFGENTLEEYTENARENQYYSAKAVNSAVAELKKSAPDIISSLDIEKEHEDNQVYNANTVNGALNYIISLFDIVGETIEALHKECATKEYVNQLLGVTENGSS